MPNLYKLILLLQLKTILAETLEKHTNRAKIGSTGYISIGISQKNSQFGNSGISYALEEDLSQNIYGNTFSIEHDDYQLFWTKSNVMFSQGKANRMDAKEVAELLWAEFIDQVGINR